MSADSAGEVRCPPLRSTAVPAGGPGLACVDWNGRVDWNGSDVPPAAWRGPGMGIATAGPGPSGAVLATAAARATSGRTSIRSEAGFGETSSGDAAPVSGTPEAPGATTVP